LVKLIELDTGEADKKQNEGTVNTAKVGSADAVNN